MNISLPRLSVAVLASMALLQPNPGPCQAATAAAANTQPAAKLQPLPADSRFTVLVEGNGPDVILIPGLSSPRAVWAGTRAALAGKARLHILEIKGFDGGDPGPNLTGPIIADTVTQLDAYIKANKLKAPAVIGHSMGGLIALLLAKQHPGDIGKAMIVDALPYVGVIFAPNATVPMLEPIATRLRDQMIASYGQPANAEAQAANAARLALKPESRAQVAAWGEKADPRVVGQAFYEDMTIDLRGEMGSIATPLTVVVPYSAAAPQAVVEPVYHQAFAPAPHVSFVLVAESAHFVMLDQPEAFASAVLTFVGTP